MSNSAVFQTQLASVIDTMAKTAITEIVKLVDDYSAILRWEMYRSQSENEGLRKKLEAMENESLMTRGESTAGALDDTANDRSAGTPISDTSRGPGARKVAEFDGGNALFPGEGFANQVCDGRGDGERPYGGETALHNAFLKDEPAVLSANEPELLIIKQEGPEEEFRSSDAGGQREAGQDRTWEEQGTLQCPTLPVARKQAPEQHCEEEWAGHYPPAEGAEELPHAHRTGPCGDQISGFQSARRKPEIHGVQNPRVYGGCEQNGGSLASLHSEFRMYDRAGAHSSDTEADDLAFCYTMHQQGALQPYGPTGEQPALNKGTAESNPESNPGTPGRTPRAEKQLSCMYCGKSFPYLSYLKRHLQNHTGERPHRCTQCGRCFIRRSHLVRHQQVHTGVKPFDCALCGRRFARLSHLDRHLSTHV
ncbi:hypothetical protein ANANG_G00113020 [Anguilla anguilla]|uniref:C2H2-type domain-containing protein n=1 Tax=Anguilla anguilla TaxID=7936 RepID=A0A9D3MJ20_ANGAN|nr:hypothetical protein ANANG_G00113020 [Anguilla anguilla]